jgi:hypothetical protein
MHRFDFNLVRHCDAIDEPSDPIRQGQDTEKVTSSSSNHQVTLDSRVTSGFYGSLDVP